MGHMPRFYIAGIYIHRLNEWRGKFHATTDELFDYAEHVVTTVEEYDVVLCMINSQQVYEMWWEKVQKTCN